MSRKTLRNATKNRSKKNEKPSDISRAGRSNFGFSGLALGSIAFGVTGVLHAQNAAPGQDQNSVPQPTTGAAQLQEIVVTGIRGSLERSLQIKKMSLGVVDAVSAESIGHFPSSSLGDAMEHVPGVTVQRSTSNLMDTQVNSTGNASSITIDGLGGDFVETLVDGRPQATVENQSRQFNFASLGADYVGEVDVEKSPDFSISSGDAGGTVNIKLPKPFDHPGLQMHALGSASVNERDGQPTPDAGGLISDTFGDNRFGFLLEAEYSDKKTLSHQLDNQGWEGTYFNSCQMVGGPTCVNAAGQPLGPNANVDAGGGAGAVNPVNAKPSWFIQNYSLFVNRTDDRSKNGRAVFQWHPADAVLVTLDTNYSDDRTLGDRAHFSNWFSSNQFTNVQTDANGTVTNFDYGPAPTDLQADWDGSYVKNMDYGLNVLWDLSDDWTAELDADQSAAYLNPNGQLEQVDADVGYGPGIPTGTNGYIGGVAVPGGNNLPYQTAPGPNSDAANFLGLNPFIIGSHVMPLEQPIDTDYINQAKLDATWQGGATKVNFGLQFVEDTRNARTYNDFQNNAWQLFSGYGPLSGNTGGVALPPSLFSGGISTANFLPGWSGNGNLAPAIPYFNPFAVYSYIGSLGPSAANPNTITAGYPAYTGGFLPLALGVSSVFQIQEKTYSPFVTATHNFRLGDMPLNVRLGLRYDRTTVDTAGLGHVLQSIDVEALDHTAFVFNYGPTTTIAAPNDYNYFLPSLDLNLMVRPDLKLRFDASRTATKPPLADLSPTVSPGGRVNALTSTTGNPRLLPLLSDNVDLGAEWYYGPNDYVSIEGYFKRVSQFAQLNTSTVNINGVMDPTTGSLAQFSQTSFVNGPSANVHGVEITWQQMLPLNFGYTINANIISTDKPYDPYIYTNQFALPGIGDSVNFIGFYEAHGFQARVSFNWQAEEFLFFGQTQNNSSTGTEPTFLEASKTVDFTTSYDISKNVNVFFEALNLNDGQYVTRGRFPNQILDIVDYGRTFTLGARLNF